MSSRANGENEVGSGDGDRSLVSICEGVSYMAGTEELDDLLDSGWISRRLFALDR